MGEMERKVKVCIVSSAGGHFRQVIQLLPILEDYEYFFVINDQKLEGDHIRGQKYFITRSQRDWRLVVNLVEAVRILRRERPQVIISAGAGCIVPFAVVGALLGCRIVYIESAAAVYKATLTGRIMYYVADLFIYQWESLKAVFPKGVYGGLIYDFRDRGESQSTIQPPASLG